MLKKLVIAILAVIAISCTNATSYVGVRDGNAVYSHCLTIILDDAHGSNVAGKGSPDGTHREWIWSRVWIAELGVHLQDIGFNVVYSAPEDTEPGLLVRKARMNAVASPAIVFSLHNNAAGMGEWKSARGFSVWTTIGTTRSDSCASILFHNFRTFIPGLAWRSDFSDRDPDYESNFTVLMSKHPSVMLEYMFQDNLLDLQLINNPQLCRTMLLVIDVSLLQMERYLCE